jgi:hypothetical protein
MIDKLKSRKLLVFITSVLIVALNNKLGLGISDDAVNLIAGLAAAFLVGQGIADHGGNVKKQDAVVEKSDGDGPGWGDTSDVDSDDRKALLG